MTKFLDNRDFNVLVLPHITKTLTSDSTTKKSARENVPVIDLLLNKDANSLFHKESKEEISRNRVAAVI